MTVLMPHRTLDPADAQKRIVDWVVRWSGNPDQPFAIVVLNDQGRIVAQGGLTGHTPGNVAEATERAQVALQPGFDPETVIGGRTIFHHDWIQGAVGVSGRPGKHQPPSGPDQTYVPRDFEIAEMAVHNFTSRGEE